MAAAARDRERIRFTYATHDGASGERRAEPHRLVNWGRRWYLVAWDIDRQDWRTFRADRISDPVGSGLRFAARELPAADIGEYVSHGAKEAQARFLGQLRVHAPAEAVAAKLIYSFATIEPIDERTCQVEAGADSAETLAAWLSFLDADFDVLGPPELQDAVAILAHRYARARPE
jgi:predicted DNA-binding transcriptional regulator YafY